MGLTKRQNDTLVAIREYIAMWGYSPTFRDLAESMQLSIGAVQDHCAALKKAGALEWQENKARTFHITKVP